MNKPFSLNNGILQSRSKRLTYGAVPPIQELRHFLAELYQSTFGGSVDFCFNIQGEPHTLHLQYVKSEGRTRWHLYNTSVSNYHLIWEKETRDVLLIHNSLLAATGETGSSVSQLSSVPTAIEAALTTNELFANLQKFLAEVQHDGNAPQKDTLAQEKIAGAGDLIDLNIGREALKELLLNELGVLSYPAFLFCLLREYAAANEHRTPLSVLLIKVTLSCKGTSCLLPQHMLSDVLERIKKLQRKTDSIGQYDLDNTFACVLPETDISGSKYFVERLEKMLFRCESDYGLESGSIELQASIASAGVFCNSVATILGSAEQSLIRVQELGQSVGVFGEQFPGQSPASKNVDLNLVQDLVEKLIVKEHGIFSFPVLVAFLEHECNRAKRNKQPLHLLLVSLINKAQSDLPSLQEAMSCLASRISSLENNNYLFAQYNENCIAVFSPKIFASALKNFGTQIINTLDDKPLRNDETISSYSVDLQLSEAELESKNMNFLRIQPYDPDK